MSDKRSLLWTAGCETGVVDKYKWVERVSSRFESPLFIKNRPEDVTKTEQSHGKNQGFWTCVHQNYCIWSLLLYICSPKLLSLGFANRKNVCLEFRAVLQEDVNGNETGTAPSPLPYFLFQCICPPKLASTGYVLRISYCLARGLQGK